jgi:CRP/FNR family transcriptional regulator, cyclic AMP receptor protein
MTPENLSRSLAQHAFVAALDPADAAFLGTCVKNVRHAAGQFLFREGEPAKDLLLLRSGRVALQSHAAQRGSVMVESVGEGDVLGWSALFPPHSWHLDAQALTPVLAFSFDAGCLQKKLDQDQGFAYRFTRQLLLEVHRRLERARLQQLDVYRAELG